MAGRYRSAKHPHRKPTERKNKDDVANANQRAERARELAMAVRLPG
jgi:hypothetical protein